MQLATACLGNTSKVNTLQTNSGIKDAFTQPWIEDLILRSRDLRRLGRTPDEIQAELKNRVHHGLPAGFLYIWLGRIIPTNFLKILSPWSSRSVKNWLSYDLKLIWATYFQNWCHRSANMAKKCENTRSLMICGYFGFFLPYLDSCDINFEGRWPKLILNHNSVNS